MMLTCGRSGKDRDGLNGATDGAGTKHTWANDIGAGVEDNKLSSMYF